MNPSPPTSTPRARRPRGHGIAWFATIAGGGAALLMFGLSPTTALTGTSPAPVTPADIALSDTSQVTSPTAVLQAPVAPPAVAPADPLVAAAQAVPVAQPKAQGNQLGASAAQPAAKAPEQAAGEHPSSSTDACGGLQAAVDAFLMHLNAAHLETSPGQQVTDALAVDQYVLAHTVLIENMLKPLVAGSDDALGMFLQHVYAAHLETSPGQQVVDVLAVDQYVKTHTVLIENMLKPLAGSDTSSC